MYINWHENYWIHNLHYMDVKVAVKQVTGAQTIGNLIIYQIIVVV